MSISEQVATSLRYCQEILVVCGAGVVDDSTKYDLIFNQEDSEFNLYVANVLGYEAEDYEGSDYDLIKDVEAVFKVCESDLLVMHNKLKELDQNES
jgi:hypothetical protein